MKAKKLAAVFLTSVLALGVLSGCGTSKSEGETKKLTKVTLNEVTHSVFYAPQYVAIEKGYFKDEGIDLKVDTGFGADKSMTALISGNADIGFMGPEASIYQYNEGNQDYAVNFAQLTQRAGLPRFQKKDQKLLMERYQGQRSNWRTKGRNAPDDL